MKAKRLCRMQLYSNRNIFVTYVKQHSSRKNGSLYMTLFKLFSLAVNLLKHSTPVIVATSQQFVVSIHDRVNCRQCQLKIVKNFDEHSSCCSFQFAFLSWPRLKTCIRRTTNDAQQTFIAAIFLFTSLGGVSLPCSTVQWQGV